jgi:protein phosphatase
VLEIACVVETGIRPSNDDRAAVNSKLVDQGVYDETAEETSLVVICDGLGGEAYGNEAAEIVTDIFSRLSGSSLTTEIIADYIDKANEAVVAAQSKGYSHSKMSTTVAGLYVHGDDFIAFNVGDSRVYRHRSQYISQLSTDHSVRQEQIELGLTPKPGQEDFVTHFIGGPCATPEIVEGFGRFFENDIFVLCTDGLWSFLDDSDFETVLSQDLSIKESCRALVDLALEKGSDDNLSAIILRRV